MNGSIPQVIGVGIEFGNVRGLLLILSCSESHLPVVSLLYPLGDNFEASSNGYKGVDAPIILLKTFRSIQIDGAFSLCEALCEVVDEALLACHSDLQLSDVVVGLLLLISEVIDEAIDDLSWCRCIVGMGSQGREGGLG